ncbi:MAG: DNA mismatch repair protein MutS [Firmicutes bacterium]|nr:DNA mismatch repair protein MutS [Bacillota bacterium]
MTKDTPMIRQYKEIKAKNQDKILLFRVGDFYELFFEDAEIGARELEIALTSRDKNIPLAGFPYHALNTYLGRLIEKGYKVAICEQVEDPKTAKGIVKREIVQVITPGTVTETSLLDEKANNYLVSVYLSRGGLGLAAVDISTGEFSVTQTKGKAYGRFLTDELSRLQPSEIIINENAENNEALQDALLRLDKRVVVNPYAENNFSFKEAQTVLQTQFQVSNLQALGCTDLPFAIAAAGAAVAYLHETQQNRLEHLHKPEIYHPNGYMVLDAATRRNLELVRTIRTEERYGSLLWVLDKTRTALGGRLLKRWLEQPLLDVAEINQRLDAVEELAENLALIAELSELLQRVYDLERLLSRVHCEKANARDLVSLRATLEVLPQIRETALKGGTRLQALAQSIPDLSDLTAYLGAAIADDPPLTLREGNLLRDGFNAELDRLRHIRRHGREEILQIQEREREKTGIKSLKVGYNKVFGYYIEVSRVNLSLVPEHYIRKQTLANAERYITQELKDFENTVLTAEEKICALEYDLFLKIRQLVASHTDAIQKAAALLARLDVYQSLARVASEYRYVRPEVNADHIIQIEDGRHPVVERVTRDRLFVPNDTYLDTQEQQILLITGPNMAGKSTYMRQTALIVLMAQIGSFVPARKAKIGLVDRIFTRIGAADDLVGGLSTFMVEMSEVAHILDRATKQSLVILDEVGRGTSTFDGISIAQAVIEYLFTKVKARTMFATHFHELAALADKYKGIKNLATAVKEQGEEIIFLHKVIPGSVDHSYGLQVARLAGLPKKVLSRAEEILALLEENKMAHKETAATQNQAVQLQLFTPDTEVMEALTELENTDILTTTPLEAMQLLYKLQQAWKKENRNGED